MSYSLALSGPMPGDADYQAPKSGGTKTPISSGGTKTPTESSASSWTGADYASAISSGANLVGTMANIASGAPQKAERDSRRQLEIARLQAQGAAGGAAAQVEIARLQAEAAREASAASAATRGSTIKMVMIGVGGLAVLGIVAAVVLRK
jgi:hypothetical protein